MLKHTYTSLLSDLSRKILWVFFFLLPLYLWAQVTTTSHQAPSPLQRLSQEVNRLATDPLLQHGYLGVSVIQAKTGEALFSHQASKMIVPASNLKVVTTATALQVLGPEFTFTTVLMTNGVLENGVLKGDLIIKGGGDPTLGGGRIVGNPDLSSLLTSWTAKLKDAGIQKIEGAVLVDGLLYGFNTLPDDWAWGDIGNYYGAAASGFNINENLYRVYFKPGPQVGDPARIVRTEPEMDLTFINEVTTAVAGTGDNAYLYAAPGTKVVYCRGTIPMGTDAFAVRGSIPDASEFFAKYFAEYLKTQGIMQSKPASKVLPESQLNYEGCKVLAEHYSPALKDIIRETNFNSLNLYAEALLRAVGFKKYKDGSAGKSCQAVQEYWTTKGIETKGWRITDGSGLSMTNTLAPSRITRMLKVMYNDSSFTIFHNSLPQAGVSGTVARLCKGTRAQGNMRLKSGSMNKVYGYTGYVKSVKGNMLAFTVIANNYEGKNNEIVARLEKILTYIALLE